jgi:hypothetical protein
MERSLFLVILQLHEETHFWCSSLLCLMMCCDPIKKMV